MLTYPIAAFAALLQAAGTTVPTTPASDPYAVHAEASAPTDFTESAAMSLESIFARLEQVQALRRLTIAAERTDRLADLDALEARLFAMAEGAMRSTTHTAPSRSAAAGRHPVGAQSHGTARDAGGAHSSPTSLTPSDPSVTDEQSALPAGATAVTHFSMHPSTTDDTCTAGQRRTPGSFTRTAKEGEPHAQLTMTGSSRRVIPATVRHAPGTAIAMNMTASTVPSAPAGASAKHGFSGHATPAPGHTNASAGASSSERQSIDQALRELRADLARSRP